MWLLWIAIGTVFGLGVAFFCYKKKFAPLYDEAVESRERCAAKLVTAYELLDSAHHAAFGPIGIRPEMKADIWNKLWVWASLPEKGMPSG